MSNVLVFYIFSEDVINQIFVNFLDTVEKIHGDMFQLPQKKQLEDFLLKEVKEMGL